ncbi:mCG144569, partial [Mus musculus]
PVLENSREESPQLSNQARIFVSRLTEHVVPTSGVCSLQKSNHEDREIVTNSHNALWVSRLLACLEQISTTRSDGPQWLVEPLTIKRTNLNSWKQ